MGDVNDLQAHVHYGSRSFTLATQENDSVSRILRDQEIFYEKPFLETLTRLVAPGGLVIDVGAHIGNHTVWFAGIMECSVLALEPNPVSHDLLVTNVVTNGLDHMVEVVQAAASDLAGTGHLLPQTPDDAGTMSLSESQDNGRQVPLTRIDDLVMPGREFDRKPIVLVKIDVEGHELEALRGAAGMLARDKPIVTTEVQSVAFFDALAVDMSKMGYVPAAVMNPTPTIIWWPRERKGLPASAPEFLMAATVKYAINKGITANERALQVTKLLARRSLRGRHLLVVTGPQDLPHGLIPDADLEVTRLRLTGPPDSSPRSNVEWLLHCLGILEGRPRPDLVLIGHDQHTWPVAQTLVNSLELPYVIAIGDRLHAPVAASAYLKAARARWLVGSVTPAEWQSKLTLDAEAVGQSQGSVKRAAADLDRWVHG